MSRQSFSRCAFSTSCMVTRKSRCHGSEAHTAWRLQVGADYVACCIRCRKRDARNPSAKEVELLPVPPAGLTRLRLACSVDMPQVLWIENV